MDIRKRILHANQKAVDRIIHSNPVWVDVLPAVECVEGLTDHMVLHSGPPIEFKDMCYLHKRGMVSGALFEGWAKDEKEAVAMLEAGEIKVDSALNHNTVGAGTGIITKSITMNVIEDKATMVRVATFPAEGPCEGGLCGWGLYNPRIADNLRYMREELFPTIQELIRKRGGLAIKPILAESMQCGDENHTRQTVADLLYDKQILPDLIEMDIPKETILKVMHYILDTPRFFHCYGQGASYAALLGAVGTDYSTMVISACGNGIEFGIQVAGLPGQWFTAPAPMMKGRYTSSKFTEKDQLPWIGDSCVVGCAGMGGFAAAASPIVCNLRGMTAQEAVAQTREMEHISIAKNPNFSIPALDFDFLPVGIDIRLVLKSGILPIIHGGMFNHEGGLIGAGMARVPMKCFEKAMKSFAIKYR